MAARLKVIYLDGRVEEVTATPRAQVLTEQHFKGGIGEHNQLQASFFAAWITLHRAGKESVEYEPWLDMIEDVERVRPFHSALEDLLESHGLQETPEAAQMLDLASRIDGDEVADEPDPTRRAPSPAISSSSASPPEFPSNPSPT